MELTHEQNINFNEKEQFIIQSIPHAYFAIFALQVYKLSERVKLLYSTLALSLETFKVPLDYFSDHVLSCGKNT